MAKNEDWTDKLFAEDKGATQLPERREEPAKAAKQPKQPKALPEAAGTSKRAQGWKPYSIMLKPDTQIDAAHLAKKNGLDLSDVTQQLLEGWIQKQQRKEL